MTHIKRKLEHEEFMEMIRCVLDAAKALCDHSYKNLKQPICRVEK